MMPIRTLTTLRRTAQMTLVALALAGLGGVAAAAPDLVLRYDQPAQDNDYGWEREALPIGNGRIGAMVFGGIAREHLQFNDITLWSGDDRETGTYQPFGDVVVDLPGHGADARDYHRLLDIAHGIPLFQTPVFVVFQIEMLGTRVIPIGKGPPWPGAVRG